MDIPTNQQQTERNDGKVLYDVSRVRTADNTFSETIRRKVEEFSEHNKERNRVKERKQTFKAGKEELPAVQASAELLIDSRSRTIDGEVGYEKGIGRELEPK